MQKAMFEMWWYLVWLSEKPQQSSDWNPSATVTEINFSSPLICCSEFKMSAESLCVPVVLRDGLRQPSVLLVHLLQELLSLLGLLLSAPRLLLQRSPCSLQLLLQTGHLRTHTHTNLDQTIFPINEKKMDIIPAHEYKTKSRWKKIFTQNYLIPADLSFKVGGSILLSPGGSAHWLRIIVLCLLWGTESTTSS